MNKKRSTAVLFVAPFLIFFILFWLIPFLYGIFMSVTNYSLINGNNGFAGLKNYIKVLASDSI